MKIEDRIRATARKKVKVIITGKGRNKAGFRLTAPDGEITKMPSKKQILSWTLARIRCTPQQVWRVEAVKGKAKP